MNSYTRMLDKNKGGSSKGTGGVGGGVVDPEVDEVCSGFRVQGSKGCERFVCVCMNICKRERE